MQVFSLALTALLLSGCKTNDDGDYISNNTFPTGRVLTNSAVSGDKFGDFTDNPFVSTASQPVSTFSVDADGASYAIVRKYLRNQYTILPSMVRIEEFLNYFTFNYPAPQDGQAVAINAEVGACPWNSGHYLLRLGIKGKELTDSEMPRANFVFLIDVSGSMQSNDKLPMLKTGLMNLVDLLNPDDRISIITALYEIVLADGYNKTDGNAPFVTFDFRYKQTLQDASISLQKTLSIYDIFYKTTLSDDFYFAAGVAAYGMLLRQSPYKGQATLEMARELVRIGHFYDPDGSRTGLLNLMGTPPRYNER